MNRDYTNDLEHMWGDDSKSLIAGEQGQSTMIR
jgi:hypothetical protein